MEHWRWVALLSQQLDKALAARTLSWPNAESVFADLSAHVKGFAGLRLLGLGLGGKVLGTGTEQKSAPVAAHVSA
jgi:hypothetical protein